MHANAVIDYAIMCLLILSCAIITTHYIASLCVAIYRHVLLLQLSQLAINYI